MKKYKYIYPVVGFILMLSMCTTVYAQVELSSVLDAELHYVNSGKVETLEANKSKEFNFKEPVWVNVKNHVPAMLIPLHTDRSTVKLETPSILEAVLKGKQKKIDAELSDILLRFIRIQSMLQRKQMTEAKAQLAELKAKYPDVHFLNFLQASVYMLTGDQENALVVLKKGLKHHPEYEAGKLLLEKLEAKQ